MEAMEYLMPDVEHKLCVRHLHANFKKKGYKGKAYKDALWVQLEQQMKINSSSDKRNGYCSP
jgi:hypothetical protein